MNAAPIKKRDWATSLRRALTPTEVVTRLATTPGWTLSGTDQSAAIEKAYSFSNYFETMAFVNAVAYIAHAQDHHPDLAVSYNRCTVRFSTHDVLGISDTDFECAAQVDALLT